ncbi:MAG: FixH family protein [Thermaurantiacus sp.]
MTRALAWLREGDRWIPGLFILAFLLLFAVNGRMVWIAVATNTGLVTDAPVITGAAALQVDIAFAGEAAREEPVSVIIRDATGAPVRGARVTLSAERTTRYAQKIRVPLEADGAVHRGRLALPLGGEWVLTARADTVAGPVEARRTFEVRPGRAP